MDKAVKYLLIFVMGIIALPGLLILVKAAKHRCCWQTGESAGSRMDEMLRESKAALDKATSQLQSAVEGIQKVNL